MVTRQPHTSPEAAGPARAMGTDAYTTSDHVALEGSADLHTVAHEAAHVVQQRGGVQPKGGVGAAGDPLRAPCRCRGRSSGRWSVGREAPRPGRSKQRPGTTLGAAAGRKTIQIEVGGRDIADQINLASDAVARKSTRGPAGKGFGKSLGVSAGDLEALRKELLAAELAAVKAAP